MTITETGRRTREQILAAAREFVGDGPVPSRETLRKELRTRFDTASEVYDTLFRERSERRAQRSREARAKLAQAARRKRPGRPRVAAVAPLPDPVAAPISVVPAPVVEPAERDLPEVDLRDLPEFVPASSDPVRKRRAATWPVVLLALPAFVAIWSGWVDLGRLTGFGVVHPLPGIADQVALNTAITLPVGLETYAAYALYVWLSGNVPAVAARFARRSAIGSLVLGAGGQVAYHLMVAAGMQRAPWWITTVVACLPVAVLGMGAALRHLVHAEETNENGAK